MSAFQNLAEPEWEISDNIGRVLAVGLHTNANEHEIRGRANRIGIQKVIDSRESESSRYARTGEERHFGPRMLAQMDSAGSGTVNCFSGQPERAIHLLPKLQCHESQDTAGASFFTIDFLLDRSSITQSGRGET